MEIESPSATGKSLIISKIGRSPSLCRSPTVKAGIDSLSCLSELTVGSSSSLSSDVGGGGGGSGGGGSGGGRSGGGFLPEVDQTPRGQDIVGFHQRGTRFEFQLLLPPVVLVLVPFVWWYWKFTSIPSSSSSSLGLSTSASSSYSGSSTGSFWLDFLAMLLFFAALAFCARVALVHFVSSKSHSLYVLRTILAHSRLNGMLLRPLGIFLDDHRDKRCSNSSSAATAGGPTITWTIGSKPRIEKSRLFGEGVQRYSNGDVYEGEFYQGRFSGSGVYYFYLSGKYEGDWVDGKYDGYGVETWARGSRYRGQYRQGLRDGYGVYRFYTGDVYSGEWCGGQSHGYGVQTCEDGSRYVGEFKRGMKHGFGYYRFRNGDTYAGEYFADKMHGYGVYHFANGHLYEGAWHEGRKQGLGLYTFRNGETQAGHWNCGALEVPSTLNPAPGSSTAVSHAKVLNVVQEARRAGKKALDVPRVDDRVNKAVAAANKAANAARVAAVKAVQRKDKVASVILNV
ncbi:alsin homolog [Selaginella moellendorffii]|uniref:alsin homolog n=1 Tax=Selaginella moellendorffii TaxID=88036 RepID=UPI000D1C773E|nr:alsin homolog [Selaginella moellendorffii]|eukprot:XP_002988599.2 alsin homolog [Selaginella moellendorffii]